MRFWTHAAATLVSLLAASPANAQSRQFSCDDGSFVTVTVLDNNSVRAGPLQGETLVLRQSRTERLYFINGDYGVRISSDQARLDVEIPDFGVIKCAFRGAGNRNGNGNANRNRNRNDDGGGRAPGGAGLPHAAQSWGGTVRAGPGIGYRKIGSLAEGQPITILEEADAPFYQDRPWFRIRYNGRTGYHWGGIICPLGAPVPGTYKVCNAGGFGQQDAAPPPPRRQGGAERPRFRQEGRPERQRLRQQGGGDRRSFRQRCRDNRQGCSAGVREACRNLARLGC